MAARGDDRPSRQVRKTARFAEETRRLGERVRALRQEHGWTLEQAAEAMQLDLKHLQKVEAGLVNVTLVTIVRIADGLGITTQELFGEMKPARRATRTRN